MSRPNLDVRTQAIVQRLVFHGARCAAVEYIRDGQLIQAAATSEVVLCAGAIGSPRLLLLSGIGPAEELCRLGIDVVAEHPPYTDSPGARRTQANVGGIIYLSRLGDDEPGVASSQSPSGSRLDSTSWRSMCSVDTRLTHAVEERPGEFLDQLRPVIDFMRQQYWHVYDPADRQRMLAAMTAFSPVDIAPGPDSVRPA